MPEKIFGIHHDRVFSHDLENNLTEIRWGESGYYYKHDFPKDNYTDKVVDAMNDIMGITPNERKAMEICSMAAQNNPDLDWDEHYNMVLNKLNNKGK